MSVTSNRTETIVYTGDVSGTETISALQNTASPGQVEIRKLSSGFTAVSVPGGGTTPTALTIWPPAGNTTSITLKGVTGDTGIALHLTDPTTIALASSVTSVGITVGADLTGIRLFWS